MKNQTISTGCYGENQWISTELGDEQGYGEIDDKTGNLMKMYPTHCLHKADGTTWNHEEHSPMTQIAGDNREVSPDIRNIGLTHVPDFIDPWQTYTERIWKPKTAILYREYTESNGKIVVEARSDAERTSMRRWTLDPEKQYQPDCLEMLDPTDGHVKRSVDLRYQKTPTGAYFLESAVYKQAGQPYADIKVIKARVCDDALPKKFSPEDIGIDDGTELTLRNVSAPPTAQSGYPLVYCQGEIIDVWEMGDRIRSGKAALGRNVSIFQEKAALGLDWRDELPTSNPEERGQIVRLTLKEARDAIKSGLLSADEPASRPHSRALSEWEIYTLRFIRDHELSDEQTQKALSILYECEERRRALEALFRNKPDKCREQCAILFENRLKDRLPSLLTRKQRNLSDSKEQTP